MSRLRVEGLTVPPETTVYTASTADLDEAITWMFAARLVGAVREHLEWIRAEIKHHDDTTGSRHEILHESRADLWRRLDEHDCRRLLE